MIGRSREPVRGSSGYNRARQDDWNPEGGEGSYSHRPNRGRGADRSNYSHNREHQYEHVLRSPPNVNRADYEDYMGYDDRGRMGVASCRGLEFTPSNKRRGEGGRGGSHYTTSYPNRNHHPHYSQPWRGRGADVRRDSHRASGWDMGDPRENNPARSNPPPSSYRTPQSDRVSDAQSRNIEESGSSRNEKSASSVSSSSVLTDTPSSNSDNRLATTDRDKYKDCLLKKTSNNEETRRYQSYDTPSYSQNTGDVGDSRKNGGEREESDIEEDEVLPESPKPEELLGQLEHEATEDAQLHLLQPAETGVNGGMGGCCGEDDFVDSETEQDLVILLRGMRVEVTSHLAANPSAPVSANQNGARVLTNDSESFLRECNSNNTVPLYPPLSLAAKKSDTNKSTATPPAESVENEKKKDLPWRRKTSEFSNTNFDRSNDSKDQEQQPSRSVARRSEPPASYHSKDEDVVRGCSDSSTVKTKAAGDTPQEVAAKFDRVKGSADKRAANRRSQLQSSRSGSALLDTPASGGRHSKGSSKFVKAPDLTMQFFGRREDTILPFDSQQSNRGFGDDREKDEVEVWGKEFMEEFCLEATGGKKYIDTHCHIDFLFKRQNMSKDSRWKLYNQKFFPYSPESFEGFVAVFCEPYAFREFKSFPYLLSEEGVNCVAAFGIHPHSAHQYNDEVERRLEEALQHEKCTALGEIGLDYSERAIVAGVDVQQQVFRRQLQLALKHRKHLVLHCRDADRDFNRILEEEMPLDWVMHRHCFTENVHLLETLLNTFPNMYIGFTNLILLRTAHEPREAARRIPLNRLLLETDAPYFMPPSVPKRVSYSHPSMAVMVAQKIASLKQCPLSLVLSQCRQNSSVVYNI